MALKADRRARTRTILVFIILATLPCYCLGLVILQIGRADQQPTATPTLTRTATRQVSSPMPVLTDTPFSTATVTETPTATITRTPNLTLTAWVPPTRTPTNPPTPTLAATPLPDTPTPTATQEVIATPVETNIITAP